MNKEEIEKLKLELLSDDSNKSSDAYYKFYNICLNHLNDTHGIASIFNYSHGHYTYFEFMGELTLEDYNNEFLEFSYCFEDEFIGLHESIIKIKYVDLIDYDYIALYDKYKNKRINAITKKIKLLSKNLSYFNEELVKYQNYKLQIID